MNSCWIIIPPEIKNDEFYHYIINLISSSTDIKTILEIGASAGDGSTEAFQLGKMNKDIKLFSIEVCTERFNVLKNRYLYDNNFFPYNVSSVSISDFSTKETVCSFYNCTKTVLNDYPLDLILSWHDKDTEYVVKNNIEQAGINKIKIDHNIDTFDCVLIDGSEFTGINELEQIHGAKYILLDDIRGFKNYDNHHKLKNDDKYMCIKENYVVRNGFSVFKLK